MVDKPDWRSVYYNNDKLKFDGYGIFRPNYS